MALRIFETDPDAAPKPRYTDEAAGQFHSGMQVDGKPVSLAEWRFTTGDRATADAVSQLLGGTPDETDSASENFIEVLTERETIQVVLAGPSAIQSDMKLWNRNKLIHHCDGVDFLSPDEKAGKPCGCPELFAERKAAAKDYMGPSPSITIRFRLADDYDLGEFKFKTGSWTMAEVLHEYDNALSRVDGEALCELTLELVEYTTKAGRAVSYRKPVVKVLKSYSDAISDPR
jgi:hypothetical protein